MPKYFSGVDFSLGASDSTRRVPAPDRRWPERRLEGSRLARPADSFEASVPPAALLRRNNPTLTVNMSTTTLPRRSDWLVPVMLILLSLVPAVFGTVRLTELARGAEVTAANARFFAQPLPVVLHILVVIPYSIVGAFQFSSGFRRRNRSWHRAAGRVLTVLGLVAALTGLWMAHFYPWPEPDGQVVYLERLVFGSAMLVSLGLAIAAIRRRDFASHGAWMTRAYAIGVGAGTQVFTHLPWFILVGKPGESSRAVLMGAGWVINVIVAEWIIRRRTARPHTVAAYATG